ncbi:putative invertase inhibitor [Telopea speciosissima]|uniref:putative invertase inhibitor n=1 Tax=Telopea speciosissima TaxID=54955 RepID=UPI001CC62129|nr:putative invertase inhibitor [Telopea speciosissima]
MTGLKSYAMNMVNSKQFDDSKVKEALKDCVNFYSHGIDSVMVAIMAYRVKDYRTSNVQMSAAFDSAFDCEDGFNERKGLVFPLKKLNQIMIYVNELPLYFTYVLSNGATGGGGDFKGTCRKCAKGDPNISYDFCVTSLQAVPKSHNSTLKELGLIAMKLTKTNASSTKSFIKNLLKNKKINPHDKLALQDCIEVYSEAIDLLKEAMNDFKDKQYSEANIKLSSAMDSSTTCEQGFNEKKKGKMSPLTKENRNLFQLAAISLSIINMVGGKSYY